LFLGHQGLGVAVALRTLILVPIALDYIGAELYGSWIAVMGAVSLLPLADLGINSVLVQRAAHHYGAGDSRALARDAWTGLTMVTLLAFLGGLVCYVAAPHVIPLMNIPQKHWESLTSAFRIAAVDVTLGVAVNGVGAVMIGLQRPTAHIVSLIVGQCVTVALTLRFLREGFGVVALPMGAVSASLAVLVWNAAALTQIMRRVNLGVRVRFDRSSLAGLLAVSWPMIISRLARLITVRSFGLTALFAVPAPTVAALDVTRRASNAFLDLSARLPMSVTSGLAHLDGEGKRHAFHEYARLTLKLALAMGTAGLTAVAAFNEWFVRLWTSPEFFAGNTVNLLTAWAGVFQLIEVAAASLLIAAGRFRQTALAYTLEAFLNVTLTVCLGAWRGPEGVAAAWFFSSLAALAVMLSGAQSVLGRNVTQIAAAALRSPLLYAGFIAVLAWTWAARNLEPTTWTALVTWCAVCVASTFLASALSDRPTRRFAFSLARRFLDSGGKM
jgi:O-antigen/teichoic acid export membrane protein